MRTWVPPTHPTSLTGLCCWWGHCGPTNRTGRILPTSRPECEYSGGDVGWQTVLDRRVGPRFVANPAECAFGSLSPAGSGQYAPGLGHVGTLSGSVERHQERRTDSAVKAQSGTRPARPRTHTIVHDETGQLPGAERGVRRAEHHLRQHARAFERGCQRSGSRGQPPRGRGGDQLCRAQHGEPRHSPLPARSAGGRPRSRYRPPHPPVRDAGTAQPGRDLGETVPVRSGLSRRVRDGRSAVHQTMGTLAGTTWPFRPVHLGSSPAVRRTAAAAIRCWKETTTWW